MAFCPSCGAQVEGRFCVKCGAAVPSAAPPAGAAAPPPAGGYQAPPPGYQQQPPAGYPPPQGYQQPPAGYPPPAGYQQPPAGYPPPAAPAAGMADNVAGMLCYLAGLITGIIFLVLEPYNKKPAIRFHAFQSIFLNVAIIAFQIAFGIVIAILSHISGVFGLIGLVGVIVPLLWFALWIYMLIATYQGKTVVLPIIGPIAQQQAGK